MAKAQFLYGPVVMVDIKLTTVIVMATQTPSTHFPYLQQLKGAIDHGEQKQMFIFLLSLILHWGVFSPFPGTWRSALQRWRQPTAAARRARMRA